jgi:hypothetical protein
VNRWLRPSVTLVSVTALLVPYGSHPWSWLGGPLAAAAMRALDQIARKPARPAPARTRSVRGAAIPTRPDPTD